jgi:hypothetical protein
MALATGELTGDARPDLLVGHLTHSSSNAGGVRLYAMDAPLLPDTGIDPSNGSLTNAGYALAIGHLNAYTLPGFTSPTAARDFAVGTRENGGAAKVWIFVR